MSDAIRRLWEEQEALRRMNDAIGVFRPQTNQLQDVYRKLGLGAGSMEFFREVDGHRKLLADLTGGNALEKFADNFGRQRKLMEGPVEEARRLGLFDPQSDIRKSIDAAMTAKAEYDRLFRLPDYSEIGRIAGDAYQASTFARELFGSRNPLQLAMEQMHSPWLRIDEDRASAEAFADIMAIGRGIDLRPAYDRDFVNALRPSLGDWRDELTIDLPALVDPILRTGVYLDHGVDGNLTDFTPEAFDEGLKVAGLRDAGPEPTDDDEESGFARARAAFEELQRFEVSIRRFIERVMLAAFGEHWMKHRLPPNMFDDWIGKRDRAVRAGEVERPLIDYADFTDYRAIIERRDNWNAVFKPVFGRPEDVRESFQRLFPVRIATMHARLVTLDDELLLSVETRRVLKAIARQ